MPRLETTGPLERPTIVSAEGADITGEIDLASSDDVTFPAVWKDGERMYDVEVWHDGQLVATVPPPSEDVNASFAEHERRRGI